MSARLHDHAIPIPTTPRRQHASTVEAPGASAVASPRPACTPDPTPHHHGRIYRGAAHDPGRHSVDPAPGGDGFDCVVVRPDQTTAGRQGTVIAGGISAESVGAKGLCLHLVTIPPGGRARAHLHAGHETALYVLSGAAETHFGPGLRRRATVRAGEFLYIPAGVPHLPVNLSADEPAVAVVARTDPNEQESVVLLPELETGGIGG